MKAMVLRERGPIGTRPLTLEEVPTPEPGPGELRVRVTACAICRTDLHVIEGDLEVRKTPVIPGHQVVGVVEALGPGAGRFGEGDRVGIAWLRSTCGTCAHCERGRENLCKGSEYTGWMADGRLRRARGRPRGLRLRDPRVLLGRRGHPAALRGHHRLPGPPAGLGAGGGDARPLRLRLLGPHRAPARPGPGARGPRGDPRRRPPGARPGAGRRLGAGGRGDAPGPPRPPRSCSHPRVRSCPPPSRPSLRRGSWPARGSR